MPNLEKITDDKNSSENFSVFLEWIKEEEKKLAGMREKIKRRLKFFKTEEANLELYKEKPDEQSAECIRKIKKMERDLGEIYQDIIRHNKSIEEIEDKIEGIKELEEITAHQLEEWDIEDEIEQ